MKTGIQQILITTVIHYKKGLQNYVVGFYSLLIVQLRGKTLLPLDLADKFYGDLVGNLVSYLKIGLESCWHLYDLI